MAGMNGLVAWGMSGMGGICGMSVDRELISGDMGKYLKSENKFIINFRKLYALCSLKCDSGCTLYVYIISRNISVK